MFPGLLASNVLTGHIGESTTGPSPRIWRSLVGMNPSPDGASRLVLVGDDFTNFGGTVTTNVGTYSGAGGMYKSYEDTGSAITQIATDKGGVITLVSDTTDNDEMHLQTGYSTGTLGAFSDTAGDDHITAFECRVKVSTIADSTVNWFIGMGEEGLAAADTITDAGALADKDFFGFNVLEADGDAIDFVYRKEGQARTAAIAGVQVPVADTYYKLGWIYNPAHPDSKLIKCFVDNVEQSTYITRTNFEAATFPGAEEMAFLVGLKNGTTTAVTLSVDWWLFGQLI